MKVITDNELKEVYPCVLYFTASWCGPCKKISPLFEELAEKNKNVHFFKIDVNENEKLATIYNVSSMPTFIYMKSNSDFEITKGANPEALKNGVNNLKK